MEPTAETKPNPDRTGPSDDLLERLSRRIVGQRLALEAIVPSLYLHRSGLAPMDRPVGTFLLLGPTGTGKTRTVEALAEVVHGDRRKILRIDCGEYQSDHEIAKLIGAPPGYVGHGESKPRLTQGSLAEVMSPYSALALVLFDEIEKAAPSLTQLLLGVLDRAILRLGDGTDVDFSNTLIFLTSNLGARQMMDEVTRGMGFSLGDEPRPRGVQRRLERIALNAIRRHFSPEFVNRIDAVVTYQPLDTASVVAILDQHIEELQDHVHTRLGDLSFEIEVTPAARYFMIDKGTSLEYGARELKRVIHKHLTQPLAGLVARGEVLPNATVTVHLREDGGSLFLRAEGGDEEFPRHIRTILVVDDNPDVLQWLQAVLQRETFDVATAGSVGEAEEVVVQRVPDAAVLDYMLPDGDGVSLGRHLIREHPGMSVVVMSGLDLEEEDLIVCRRYRFPCLRKPFMADELISAIRSFGTVQRKAVSRGI